MGAVYKARDQHLDRLAAIKVLSASSVSNQESQLRFVQEAKSASALNHPNIVTIYEIDTAGDIAFIAMEYIDGHTLDRLIPQRGLPVTQQLNSSTPMGRLTLHILLSFAQFEREIISERTRDKQSAARRKCKWTGVWPAFKLDG